MNFERRDFLRVTSAGLAGGIFNFPNALAQVNQGDQSPTQPPAGQKTTNSSQETSPYESRYPGGVHFNGGSGSLVLHLKFKTGSLDVHVENFSRGDDKLFIMDGTFEPADKSKKPTRVYRSYFGAGDGNEIFARLGDGHEWTTLVMAPSERDGVESLTVWNTAQPVQTFHIDRHKFNDDPHNPDGYVIDIRGRRFDLQGKREPPPITAEELQNSLENLPDYVAFTRGRGVSGRHAAPMEFVCGALILIVPGGALYIIGWNAW